MNELLEVLTKRKNNHYKLYLNNWSQVKLCEKKKETKIHDEQVIHGHNLDEF